MFNTCHDSWCTDLLWPLAASVFSKQRSHTKAFNRICCMIHDLIFCQGSGHTNKLTWGISGGLFGVALHQTTMHLWKIRNFWNKCIKVHIVYYILTLRKLKSREKLHKIVVQDGKFWQLRMCHRAGVGIYKSRLVYPTIKQAFSKTVHICILIFWLFLIHWPRDSSC